MTKYRYTVQRHTRGLVVEGTLLVSVANTERPGGRDWLDEFRGKLADAGLRIIAEEECHDG